MVHIADPQLKFTGQFTKRSKTNYIVLHHAAASSCTVNDVHAWHLGNGWLGIGYQFFVDKTGGIYKGRPIDVMGAHVTGFNDCSIGVCVEGDYSVDVMPIAQYHAIIELVKYLLKRYPEAIIKGHYDLVPTICPGYNFPFDEIVAAALGTLISGESQATIAEAQAWARSRQATEDFVNLAPIYWEEAAKRGIRADIAYAQSAKETAFGRFGGTVTRSHNNWCGLKTREGGSDSDPNAHAKFPDDRTGIIAHIQHLCAYAGICLTETIVDPRYVWVNKGSAPTLEMLSGKWAPSLNYGVSILDDYLIPMLGFDISDSEVQLLREQVLALTAHRDSLLEVLEQIKTILGGV